MGQAAFSEEADGLRMLLTPSEKDNLNQIQSVPASQRGSMPPISLSFCRHPPIGFRHAET